MWHIYIYIHNDTLYLYMLHYVIRCYLHITCMFVCTGIRIAYRPCTVHMHVCMGDNKFNTLAHLRWRSRSACESSQWSSTAWHTHTYIHTKASTHTHMHACRCVCVCVWVCVWGGCVCMYVKPSRGAGLLWTHHHPHCLRPPLVVCGCR